MIYLYLSVPESCNLESYVDDLKTFLLFTLSNMNHPLQQVEDLLTVFEWHCRKSLVVNPEKTKIFLVGTGQLTNQLEAPIHINFMGETLTPVTEVKDLRVFLDSCLTYDKHIQALSSSYISKLCQIGQVKHNFNQQTLATIIDTLVRSTLTIALHCWLTLRITILRRFN